MFERHEHIEIPLGLDRIWTSDEEQTVLNKVAQYGASQDTYEGIAKKLRRTIQSIESKYHELRR